MVQRPDLKSEKMRLMSEDHSERTEGRLEGQRVVSLSLVIKTPLHLPVRSEQCCMNEVRREVNSKPNCFCLKL